MNTDTTALTKEELKIKKLQETCKHEKIESIGIRWGGYSHYCTNCKLLYLPDGTPQKP